jgi:hypothetical protein
MCIATRFFHYIQGKDHNAKNELTAFTLLKHRFVRCMKEWTTYCHHYHTNLVELCIGLNNMHSKIGGIRGNCDIVASFTYLII